MNTRLVKWWTVGVLVSHLIGPIVIGFALQGARNEPVGFVVLAVALVAFGATFVYLVFLAAYLKEVQSRLSFFIRLMAFFAALASLAFTGMVVIAVIGDWPLYSRAALILWIPVGLYTLSLTWLNRAPKKPRARETAREESTATLTFKRGDLRDN